MTGKELTCLMLIVMSGSAICHRCRKVQPGSGLASPADLSTLVAIPAHERWTFSCTVDFMQ